MERELEESYAKSTKDSDERIMKMLEEDWTVGDVPETFRHLRKGSEQEPNAGEAVRKPSSDPNKAPATIASRRAASALSVAPKTGLVVPKTSKPQQKPTMAFLSRQKPAPLPPSEQSTVRNSVAQAATRSTLGFHKGRSASGVLKKGENSTAKSTSNVSQVSDTTITPARFAQNAGKENNDWKSKLAFLSAFDVDDDDLEPGLRGALPDCLRREDEDDEEFFMTLGK